MIIRILSIGALGLFCALHVGCDTAKKPKKKDNNAVYDPYQPGGTNPPVNYPQGTGNAFGQLNCTQGDCPRAQVQITSGGGLGSTLQAYVNQPVSWNFTATATNTSGRTFQIFDINPISPQIPVVGRNSASPRVNWTPDSRSQRTGTITVKARDMTQCQALGQGTANQCNSFTVQQATYDHEQTFTWMIEGNQDGGLLGGGGNFIASALPALIQVFQGGDISGLLGTLLGGLNNGNGTGGGLLGN